MTEQFRKKLVQKLAMKAKIADNTILSFKHCSIIAELIECDANTVARLIPLSTFKATQCLQPELEHKITVFLGYKSYENLERHLTAEIVADCMKDFDFDK